MRIIVSGLRRSGTTIFWQTLRQDERLLSLNEPFNPDLNRLVNTNHWAYTDYVEQKIPIQEHPMGIPLSTEMGPGSCTDQFTQLQTLLEGRDYNINSVRTVFKFQELLEVFNDSLHIFLFRNLPAFVSSHILPSSPNSIQLAHKLRTAYRRSTFWNIPGNYNYYGYQEILEKWNEAGIEAALQGTRFSASSIDKVPAYVKLATLWEMANAQATEMERIHPERFMRVKFEDFLREPDTVLQKVYRKYGRDIPRFCFDKLRPSNNGYKPDSQKWKELPSLNER